MNSSQYISPERQEHFERYLFHQMNAQEETAFEEALRTDADFASQFSMFKELVRSVETEGLRSKLDAFHQELPPAPQSASIPKSSVRWYPIAAGVVVLIGLSLWFFTRIPSNERLYASHFKPDPGLPTVMGSASEYDFYEAMVDYKKGDYEAARKKWVALTTGTSTRDTLNYFIASAYMAEKDQRQAIAFFKKVLQSPEKSFDNETYYYLGLAYLKLGELDLAVQNLEKSGTEAGNQLLEELKE